MLTALGDEVDRVVGFEVGVLVRDGGVQHLHAAELCVLDPLVAYSAVRLGIADLLRASLPQLAVTQTTLDMLRELVEERRNERRGRRGSLSWAGGRYIVHEMSEGEIEERISAAEQALGFAERCRLVPAEASGPVPAQVAGVYETLPPAFHDALISAQGPGCVLLCDDHTLRCVGEAAGVRGVWTQAALQHAVLVGRIALGDYADAIAKLAEAGYSYVRFGAAEILHEFRRCDWQPSARAHELLRRLALPGNDPASVVQVGRDLLLLAWPETEGDARFNRLASALAGQFERTQPEKALTALDAILSEVRECLRARAWRLNRKAWLHTTRLVPPSIAGNDTPLGTPSVVS